MPLDLEAQIHVVKDKNLQLIMVVIFSTWEGYSCLSVLAFSFDVEWWWNEIAMVVHIRNHPQKLIKTIICTFCLSLYEILVAAIVFVSRF